ncbi:hypothetical protein [Clostridium sp. C2-6-12]|uniref:hypothetical protein n=1 Tax=Clostridium sp. C2-6-12 TaxID=2698832 RepID=UPI00136EBC77|nr:hypothetical protein [Clostridium sp. C2-6-12]
MKKKILNQLIAAALVCGSLLSVGNVSAYAADQKKEDVKFTKTWVAEGDKNGFVWHYYNENGQIAKNTTIIGPNHKTEVKIDENGVGQVDWEYGVKDKYEDGKFYYINALGQKTGWVKDNQGLMHYYNEKGEMLKNTTVKNQLGKEVKLNDKGVLVGENGYDILNGIEVTYDSSEAYKKSQKEWKQVGSDWTYHYADQSEDKLVHDWEQINGVWFYFNDKGIMQKSTTIKDYKGNENVLNADGALTGRTEPKYEYKENEENTYTQKVIDGKTYFEDAKGVKQIGWVMYDEKWYYTNKDGVMQKDTTIIEGDKKFVLDANGNWIN